MKFRYQARSKEGELQVGFVEAVSKDAAAGILTSHELFVLSLESAEKENFFDRLSKILKKVRYQDLVIFTRQFATLMEADISISDSLRALNKQTKNPYLKEAVFDISNDINGGLSLSQAMEKRSDVFSEFYISMIRSAELTGRLDEAMNFLADYLEKDLTIRNRIRNALIYPAVVVVLFLVIGAIMVTFVFPQIKPIFEESGTKLPVLTNLLLSSGDFLKQWWIVVLVIIALFAVLAREYLRTPEGKGVSQELLLRSPVFGVLFRKIYTARFASATSILVKGGVPIAQAIEISAHTIGSAIYSEILHEAADNIRRGEMLSSFLSRYENYFPPLVSQMIAVGEGTGRMDDLLMRISNFYSREVDDTVASLVELIQPLLIVIIGGCIALLFASVLMPIYNLSQVIQ
ncbi:MAG: type II secretion system F family protein [Candidatus Paceibacterota bacterium]|jgi:type IV pilus assembly protein PilC